MWTDRKLIAYPITLFNEATRLAALIDPDTGGAETFSLDRTRGQYVFAEIPFKSDFWPIVERRDPDEWVVTMAAVAQAFNREPLPEAMIRELCVACLIGDEVPSDDPA